MLASNKETKTRSDKKTRATPKLESSTKVLNTIEIAEPTYRWYDDIKSDFWAQLSQYALWLLVLMVLAIPLKECLYERSKDWMRALAPYKNPNITNVIQVFSYIGDGDFFFYVASFFYIFGKNEDFIYLSVTFLCALQLCNLLKAFYHHSRPQYDDVTLADINVGSCAGEFGNPSGHSLLSCQFIPTLILFCK